MSLQKIINEYQERHLAAAKDMVSPMHDLAVLAAELKTTNLDDDPEAKEFFNDMESNLRHYYGALAHLLRFETYEVGHGEGDHP